VCGPSLKSYTKIIIRRENSKIIIILNSFAAGCEKLHARKTGGLSRCAAKHCSRETPSEAYVCSQWQCCIMFEDRHRFFAS